MRQTKKVFVVLFIAVFSSMVGLGIVGPLLPIYAQHLGASGMWLGIIFASFSLARAIFMPLVGKISDRTSRKKFITLGLMLYTIISLLYIWADSKYSLTVIRFIHGIASAMVIPIAMAYIGETTKQGKEGSRMGLFNISFFLGMGSGPFIGGVLYDKFGMNAVFEAMAVLTGFAFLLTLIALPDIKPTTAKVKDKAKQKQFSFKALLANDLLIGLLIYRFINALGRGGVMSFVPVLAEKIHITPGQVGIIISANVFFMAVLQGLFGYLSDRYNKFYLVLIGAIIATVGLALIPLAHTFWSLMILALVMGLGGAISMPAATAINVKIGQHHGMGASMGLFNMAMSVGMILAPLISGGVMDLWGVKYIFYVAGGISAVGILFFFYFVRRGLKQEGSHKYL